MSNAGMTTLVKVWCNFVSPNFSLISLCKYLPLYCGPNRVLVNFTIDDNKFQHLYIFRTINYTVNQFMHIDRQNIYTLVDLELMKFNYGKVRATYLFCGKIFGVCSRQKFLISLAAYKGRLFSFGAVSIAVTNPPVLVPAITSK